MPEIAVDTGPLVALFDGAERHHAAAVAFLRRSEGPIVTNVAVLTEAAALLDFSDELPAEFLVWASKALLIDGKTDSDLPRIAAIMRKYKDLPADFADASLVALCERRNIEKIATLDRAFGIYRTAKRRALQNIFFELDG